MTTEPTGHTQPDAPNTPAPEAPHPGPGPVQLPTHRVKRTRMGGLWVAAAGSALVLLLLLIFILENGQRVSISYFGAHGHMPLGVALLLAAVLGVLLVVIPGTGRIIQLRMAAHRHRRLDAATQQANAAASRGDEPRSLRRARRRPGWRRARSPISGFESPTPGSAVHHGRDMR
jgi:uncharacterized integral membrane protein